MQSLIVATFAFIVAAFLVPSSLQAMVVNDRRVGGLFVCAAAKGGSGVIKAYEDPLSLPNKGKALAGGDAHRMKESLMVYKADLVAQDDSTYPLIAPISDPHPTITLDQLSVSTQQVTDGVLSLTISGTVEDTVADFDRAARPQTVTCLGQSAAITDTEAPQSDPVWRPHAWRGRFSLPMQIPLKQDNIRLSVSTTNALGNKGFAPVDLTAGFHLVGPPDGTPLYPSFQLVPPTAVLAAWPQAGTATVLDLSTDGVIVTTMTETSPGTGEFAATLQDGTTWRWSVSALAIPPELPDGTPIDALPLALGGPLVVTEPGRDPVTTPLDVPWWQDLQYSAVLIIPGVTDPEHPFTAILDHVSGNAGDGSSAGLVKPMRLRRKVPADIPLPQEAFRFGDLTFHWQTDPQDATAWVSDKAVLLTQLPGGTDPQVVNMVAPADSRVYDNGGRPMESYCAMIVSDSPHDTVSVGRGLTVKLRAPVAGWMTEEAFRALTEGTWKLVPAAQGGGSGGSAGNSGSGGGSSITLSDVSMDIHARHQWWSEVDTVFTLKAAIPTGATLGLYDLEWTTPSGVHRLPEQVRIVNPTVVMLCLDGMNGELFKEAIDNAPPGSGLDLVFGKARTGPGASLEHHQWFSPSPTRTSINSLPTITWCNWATIFTGSEPGEHGILGNSFFRRDVANSRPVFSANADVDSADKGDHKRAAFHGLSSLLRPGVNTIFQDFTASFPNALAVSIHAWYTNQKGNEFSNPDDYAASITNEGNLKTERYAEWVLPNASQAAYTVGMGDYEAMTHHNAEGARAADRVSRLRAAEYLDAIYRGKEHPNSINSGQFEGLPSLIAIYFPGPDNMGHATGRKRGESNDDATKSLQATKDHLMSDTDGEIKRIYNQLKEQGVLNAVIWLAVSDHGLMGSNLIRHPRQSHPFGASPQESLVSESPLTGNQFSLREKVRYLRFAQRWNAYTQRFEDFPVYRSGGISEMEVFFRRVFDADANDKGQDDTTNTVWYGRAINDGAGGSVPPVSALWSPGFPVNAVYSPDGGLAHVYVREDGADWRTGAGSFGAKSALLAWYLAKESLGDFTHFPGGKPLMPINPNNPAEGSQFQHVLDCQIGGRTVAGVFVLQGNVYKLAVPGDTPAVVDLVDVSDNENGGSAWKSIKTRLDRMVNSSASSVSRSGDIVLLFNIIDGYISVNDDKEEELNGWHGGASLAESVTPLVYATAAYGSYPSDNAGLPSKAASFRAGSGEYRNAFIRDSIRSLMRSLTGQ